MAHPAMLDNILAQPASLSAVLGTQTGEGQAAFKEAAALLRRSTGRVLITGMGASYFAALPGARRMQALGRDVHVLESSDLLYAQRPQWGGSDCAILISRSGGSVEVLKLADRLRDAGTPFIGITNVPGSPLTKVADAAFAVGSLPDELIAVQSFTGTVLALQLLVEETLAGGAEPTAERVTKLLPSLGTWIASSLELSLTWEEFFTTAMPLYLLGRGAAMATVHEGSLLMHETAKSATVAMASAQFRHGPVEIVDGRFRAVLVGTDPQTRDLDAKLGQDLERMGGQVRWIGAHTDNDSLQSLSPWPAGVFDDLSPLFDIVPLQIAAFRLAVWRGIVPGAFRFASEITQDESSFPFFEKAKG